MSRLTRLDRTAHTTLAEWTADDSEAQARALEAFRRELEDEGARLAPQPQVLVEQVDSGHGRDE